MQKYQGFVIVSLIIAGTILPLTGCSVNNGKAPATKAEQSMAASDKAIVEEFKRLAANSDTSAASILDFINRNKDGALPQTVTAMLIVLQKTQQNSLPAIEAKYTDSHVQTILAAQGYHGELNRYLQTVNDQSLQSLLQETQNSGFKIETAEGFYFPVIDYSAYKPYRQAATPDMAEYINLMAVESDQTPIKDAGLMIGWEEIIKRARSHEQYISKYHSSETAADVNELLRRYLVFALYGANNTPLFAYEDKIMTPAAKQAYLGAGFQAGDGVFSKVMAEYVELLKRNNYQLTTAVEEFREKATGNSKGPTRP
jgi:hypothetical protein